jgi:hypothetical protein
MLCATKSLPLLFAFYTYAFSPTGLPGKNPQSKKPRTRELIAPEQSRVFTPGAEPSRLAEVSS